MNVSVIFAFSIKTSNFINVKIFKYNQLINYKQTNKNILKKFNLIYLIFNNVNIQQCVNKTELRHIQLS